ncbi:MAG: DNA polymerase subunit beta, partial [Lachnospiraceae bacterium]|nr:DNA polymerase subunit beta [Lachnospiraceae bacterium]
MEKYESLLDSLVQQSKNILGDNLVGIYLHGSAVMGCFNDKKSDIDFIVVIKTDISNELKRQYMSMAVELNKQAPTKGIEFSIVRENVCNPFVYPTPFELHFSITHLNWYLSDSEDYIEKMKGTDKDLAAHFTIIYHRGKTLFGKDIKEVFAKVS